MVQRSAIKGSCLVSQSIDQLVISRLHRSKWMQKVFVIHVFAVGNWAIFGLVVPPVTCLLSVQITILPERVNDLATVRPAQGSVCVRALANGKLLRMGAQGVEYVLLGISLAMGTSTAHCIGNF